VKALLCFVTLAAVAGCSAPVAVVEVGSGPRTRLIADPPELLLPAGDLYETVALDRWTPSPERWRVTPAGAVRSAADGGIGLEVGDRWVVLETERDQRWDEARRVEVVVAGVEHGEVRLRWGEPGADGDAGAVRMARVPGGEGRYRAEVDGHPSWIGAEAVRLEIRSAPGSQPRLEEIELLAKRLERRAYREVAGAAVKMELESEARDAFLVGPRHPVVHRLQVAGPSRLRFGYGAPAAADRPVELRIEVVSGGRRTVAFRDLLGPGAAPAGRWHRGEVDLSPHAGGEVRLEVRTDAGAGADPARSWMLWSNPEVLADAGGDAGPSLVLVSVDALRADRLSLYGHDRPTSPSIDRWATERAAVFEQVVAAAPWTLPAHVSMFTGLDAVRHGVNHDVGDARRPTGPSPTAALEMLAETLRRAGFATAAFTGGGYVHPRYGLAQGFERYASWPDRSDDAAELEVGVDRSLEWISSRQGERFFLFLHTYAVHDPYRPWSPHLERVAPEHGGTLDQVAIVTDPPDAADGFRQRNRFVLRNRVFGQRPVEETDLPLVRALYDAGVGHADEQVARLLEGLERIGIRDRTVVVLTSDHGESLGEHGRVGHVDLSDEAILVPLVIEVPGGRGAGVRVAEQVRQVDLAPTLLELLGVEVPPGLDGVSLAEVLDGGPVPAPAEAYSWSTAANRGLGLRVAGRLKYVLDSTAWRAPAGREAAWDLVADPTEGAALAAADPRVGPLASQARDRLEERLTGLRLEVRNPGSPGFTVRLEGAAVQGVGTEAIGLDGPWVRWLEPGVARLAAPPGASYTVVLEKVMDPVMRLAGGVADGGASFEWEADARELGDGRWLVLEGRRWRERREPPATDEPSLGLRWHGPAAIRAASPAADDLELRDQLRALGYVE